MIILVLTLLLSFPKCKELHCEHNQIKELSNFSKYKPSESKN